MWLDNEPPKRKPSLLSSSPWRSLHAVGSAEMCRMTTSPMSFSCSSSPLTLCSSWQTREQDTTAIKLKKKKSQGHLLTRCCKQVKSQVKTVSSGIYWAFPFAWLDIRFEFWWVRMIAGQTPGEVISPLLFSKPKSCISVSFARCQLQWNPGVADLKRR